jgi:trans-aconitate methyltransferase
VATIERALGAVFEDEDVARCYRYRPPYAPELWELLVAQAPATRRALDLGCGDGKIAHQLARRFDHVHAVDPSAAMLMEARRSPSRIQWEQSSAERAAFAGPYDLVTMGASAHWMDHDALFPRLASTLSDGGVVAFVEGDAPSAAPWSREWKVLVDRWLRRLDRVPDAAGYARDLHAHERWLEVLGRRAFTFAHEQRLEHFIELQHSRATWARARMGSLAAAMDEEMRALLEPHASDGVVHYTLTTHVTWGHIAARPSAGPKPGL